MTDNEIIKDLEKALKVADETINRQKAEIEELQTDGETLAISLLNAKKEIERITKLHELAVAEREANVRGFTEELAKVKSEAIKEFAERLKEKAYPDGAVSISQELVVDVRDIDELVEEMIVNYESTKNDKQRKEDGNDKL